jgi:hypothetical protein
LAGTLVRLVSDEEQKFIKSTPVSAVVVVVAVAAWSASQTRQFLTWAKYYKTFYVRNLQMNDIS